MFLAGFLSFLFGIAQAFFLKKTLSALLGGEYSKTVLFFLVKLICYAVAAVTVAVWWKARLFACAVGYGAGLPLAVTVYFSFITFRKKDGDSNENTDHH